MSMQGFNVLVVEDNPNRIEQFSRALVGNHVTFARTAKEGIAKLRMNNTDILFLDHDLGESGTGYDVALFLRENPEHTPSQVVVHSMNTVGANNICAILPKAERIPLVWEKL
jgi:CheY-like chemotaxis protein